MSDKQVILSKLSQILENLSFENIETLFQIAFWITAAAVAVLTYRQARNGLLQPIRTEIFKIQIEEIRKIIALLSGKTEHDLRKESGIDKLFDVNAIKMFDSYALLKFNVKVDEHKRPYQRKECPLSFISPSWAEKNLKLLDGHKADDDKNEDFPALKWEDYEHGEISIPKSFSEYSERLELLISNPVLPTEIVIALQEYKKALHDQVGIVGSVLTDAAKKWRAIILISKIYGKLQTIGCLTILIAGAVK